jgi:hypothetical protein
MSYVGIDLHRRYSVLAAQDEAGRTESRTRIADAIHEGSV